MLNDPSSIAVALLLRRVEVKHLAIAREILRCAQNDIIHHLICDRVRAHNPFALGSFLLAPDGQKGREL